MTALHQGITFLPKMAVNKGVGQAEKLSIEKLDKDFYREIGVLWRKTSMRNPLYNQLGLIVEALLK